MIALRNITTKLVKSVIVDSNFNLSSRLSVGDYIPQALLEGNEHRLDIQSKAGEPNIFVVIKQSHLALSLQAIRLSLPYRHFVLTEQAPEESHPRLFTSKALCELFFHPLVPMSAFVTDHNLKVVDFVDAQNLEELCTEFDNIHVPSPELPAPVLVIPNAIDEVLADDLMRYLDAHEESGSVADRDFKRRLHIHPDKDLEHRLDDKLCKSVLPEIEKVFYSEVSHRETYKICRYDGDNSGKFGKHRDTIAPHLHRRYAITLVLNDDYAGGGIAFPEYNSRVLTIPKYGAVVFPGSLFHQVNEIASGSRYVIISFFFGEAEANVKEDSERYRFTVKRNVEGLALTSLMPNQSRS